MKIGIIGLGVVGSALKKGLSLFHDDIKCHDLKLNTTVYTVKDTDIVFICVPTPSLPNGKCNTENVEKVLDNLFDMDYNGIVAIKSSVTPGFTEKMNKKYIFNLNIAFVPEFLKERCAEKDFICDHKLLAVGTRDVVTFQRICDAHGFLPKDAIQLSPTEAEVLKYYSNVYNSTRIVFANVFYEICNKMGCNYKTVKDAYLKLGNSTGKYLEVNDHLRGYSGMCLPKDVKAIVSLIKELGIDMDLIESVEKDNEKLEKHTIGNMRG